MSVVVGVDYDGIEIFRPGRRATGLTSIRNRDELVAAFIRDVSQFKPESDESGEAPQCQFVDSDTALLLQVVLVKSEFASKVPGANRQKRIDVHLKRILGKYKSALGVIVVVLPDIEAISPKFKEYGLDKLPTPTRIWETSKKRRYIDFDSSNLDTFQPKDDRKVVADRIYRCVAELDFSDPKIAARVRVPQRPKNRTFSSTEGIYIQNAKIYSDSTIQAIVQHDAMRLNEVYGPAPIEWLKYHSLWTCTRTKRMEFNVFQIFSNFKVRQTKIDFEQLGGPTSPKIASLERSWTLVNRRSKLKKGNEFAEGSEDDPPAREKSIGSAITWSIGDAKDFGEEAAGIRDFVFNTSETLYSAEWKALAAQSYVPSLEDLLLATLCSYSEQSSTGAYLEFPRDRSNPEDEENEPFASYNEKLETLAGNSSGFVGFSLVYQPSTRNWGQDGNPECKLGNVVTFVPKNSDNNGGPSGIEISLYNYRKATLKTTVAKNLSELIETVSVVGAAQRTQQNSVCAIQLIYHVRSKDRRGESEMVISKVTIPICQFDQQTKLYLLDDAPPLDQVLSIAQTAPDIIDLDQRLEDDIPLLEGFNLKRLRARAQEMNFETYSRLAQGVEPTLENKEMRKLIGKFNPWTESAGLYVFMKEDIQSIKNRGSDIHAAANLCLFGRRWLKMMDHNRQIRFATSLSDRGILDYKEVAAGDITLPDNPTSLKSIEDMYTDEKKRFGVYSLDHAVSRREKADFAWVTWFSQYPRKRQFALISARQQIPDPKHARQLITLATRNYGEELNDDYAANIYEYKDVIGIQMELFGARKPEDSFEITAVIDYFQQQWKLANAGLKVAELSRMADMICFLAGVNTVTIGDSSELQYNDRTLGNPPARIRGRVYSLLKHGQGIFYLNPETYKYYLAVGYRITDLKTFREVNTGAYDSQVSSADSTMIFIDRKKTETYRGNTQKFLIDLTENMPWARYFLQRFLFDHMAQLSLRFFSGSKFLELCREKFKKTFGFEARPMEASLLAEMPKYEAGMMPLETLDMRLLKFAALAYTHAPLFESATFFTDAIGLMFKDARPMIAIAKLFKALCELAYDFRDVAIPDLDNLARNFEAVITAKNKNTTLSADLYAQAFDCILYAICSAESMEAETVIIKTRAQMMIPRKARKREVLLDNYDFSNAEDLLDEDSDSSDERKSDPVIPLVKRQKKEPPVPM